MLQFDNLTSFCEGVWDAVARAKRINERELFIIAHGKGRMCQFKLSSLSSPGQEEYRLSVHESIGKHEVCLPMRRGTERRDVRAPTGLHMEREPNGRFLLPIETKIKIPCDTGVRETPLLEILYETLQGICHHVGILLLTQQKLFTDKLPHAI